MSIERLGQADTAVFRRHRVTETGDYYTMTELTKPAGGETAIKKLSATEYLYVPTGEVRPYTHHAQTRDESVQSLRRTMRHIRELVNTNVRQDNADRVHWLTFTYADRTVKGAPGAERVARDFDVFFKRFTRYCERRGFKRPEYITVMEAQRDGVWHLHALFIWHHKRPFIPNDTIAAMWEQGFTKTQRLPHANMGAYLTAYLTDAAIEDLTPEDLAKGARSKEVKEREVDGKKKKFVKGARLYFYPSGCNIVRHSRGLEYPTTYDISAAQMEAMQQEGELMFSQIMKFTDDATGYEMTVARRVYRKRRRREDAA